MNSKAVTFNYNCERGAKSESSRYLSERTNYTKYTSIGVLNVFLLAATLFLIMYFVIISNITTASNYKIGLLNEELSELIETNGLLTAQKLSIEDSSIILNFAQAHNMIEAGHVIHIFESSGVALKP